MNISGIRPKQEFYAGVERREPEKKEIHRLNQVAIRMVEMLWQIRFGIMTGKLLLL